MSSALLVLLRLTWRGRLRRSLRGLRQPRGAVFSLLGLVVIAGWVGPALWLLRTRPAADPEAVASVATSVLLLALCSIALMPAAAPGAAYFSPAEVDFLFTGPFSRRALLVYKIGSALPRVGLAACLVTLIELVFLPWWVSGAVGIFLTLLFLQLFGMTVALVTQTLAGRAHSTGRQLALVALGLLCAAAVWRLVVLLRPEGLLRSPRGFLASDLAHALPLTPLDVFARAIAAPTAADLVVWALPALAIDVAMLGVVFWLDARWQEGLLLASQRAFARLSRRRHGGGPLALLRPVQARWALPDPPWIGGAGPLIWRQLTTLIRQPWTFVGVAVFALVMLAPTLAAAPSAQGAALAVLMVGPLFGMWLQNDFRGDVDHLPVLKALPLDARVIAAGEIACPALLTAAVQLAALLAVAVVTGDVRSPLITACFVPALSVMLFGAQNLTFLLLPARMNAATAGDFQHATRLAVLWALQLLMLIAGAAAAIALGVLAARAAGGSWALGLAAAWAVVTAEACSTIPVLGWAYRRFDVSLDTPP